MFQLNTDQQEAYVKIMDFLVNEDEQAFCLLGAGGVGKTTIIREISNHMEAINKARAAKGQSLLVDTVFCATTNKAATLFDKASTVHKLFGLSLKEDYRTGKTSLTETYRTAPIYDHLIVVDEASMMDSKLAEIVMRYSAGSKVLLLLDPNQLAPVGEKDIWAMQQGFDSYELTQPMRQDPNSHLYKTCSALRAAVADGAYVAPVEGEGVRYVDQATFVKESLEAFRNGESTRVLSYSNDSVEDLNAFYKTSLYGTKELRAGDLVVAATAHPKQKVSVEQMFAVTSVEDEPNLIQGLRCQRVGLSNGNAVLVPVDKKKYFTRKKALAYEARKSNDWRTYFAFMNEACDLRYAYACTTHKSQGSTFDKVFINLEDIIRTAQTDVSTLLRAIYVAVSRARTEVVIFDGSK